MLLRYLIPLYSLASASLSVAQPRPISVQDFRDLADLGNPTIAPDGKSVALIKTTSNYTNDQKDAKLIVVSTSTGAIKSLAMGSRQAANPHWSPRGNEIAFVSQSKKKQDEVFVVPARGGRPKQVTHSLHGVKQYAWSPAGDRIAYVTQDDPVNASALARHDDLFDVHDVGFLSTAPSTPSHLWVVSRASGKATRLTSGSWSVLETPGPFVAGPADPSWSADGKKIAFCRQANADNSDGDLSRVAVVDVATSGLTELTDKTTYEYQATFSPTSGAIAYAHPESKPLSCQYVWSSDEKTPLLTPGADLDVSQFSFMPDGRSIVALASRNIEQALFQVPLGGAPRELNMSGLSASGFAVGGEGLIAMVASSQTSASELYVYDDPDSAPRQLTHINSRLSRFAWGKVEEFSWTGADGEKSDGVLSFPVGYRPGHKFPLFVWLHGGPEAASVKGFATGEIGCLRQVLAGKGFFVFEPNYRGSDNLGNAHEMAIFGNPAEGPASDILSGIEALLQNPDIAADQISVGGHSYGGLLSAWLISHDHRWNCSIVADGVVDWTATYNLSNFGNLAWVRDSLGGTPSDPAVADLYRTGSPLTYANQVSTPTLILSGTSDQQVPVVESYAFYHALKDRSVPVRFVALPGAEHSPSRPVQRERYYEIIVDWILSQQSKR